MDIPEFHDRKMKEIIAHLEAGCHGYTIDTNDGHLTEMPAHKLQKELLNRKTRKENCTPLVDAVCHFHDKQLSDRNSHFALTNVLTKEALEKAKLIEGLITPHNTDKFPLYGFVLSVKESIRMKGYASTYGLVSNMEIWKSETPFISYLESKGAVIISRTNVPQLLFAFESWNNIFGSTSNPFDKSRTAGGSSGGDAALIALGHVNAGIGSDLAGSLRIPAFFCGICSIHLTPPRIDISGHAILYEQKDFFKSIPDFQYVIGGSIGPMAKSVHDLTLLAQELINFSNLNMSLPPVPWRLNFPVSKRIGVIVEWDNLFELTETNRRAMSMAINVLKTNGYEVVEIDMRPYVLELFGNIFSIFFKNDFLNYIISGKIPIDEPLMPFFEGSKKLLSLPKFALKLLLRLIRDPTKRIYLDAFYQSKQYNCGYFLGKINEKKQTLLDDMKRQNVQELICPGMMPAILKGTSTKCGFWTIYLCIWNGLHFPVGALPITRVLDSEQDYNSKFNGDFEKSIKEGMANAKGLPVGIQVVSLSYRDEAVLKVMKIIEDGVGFK
jgi:fatty acid amide hydrolase